MKLVVLAGLVSLLVLLDCTGCALAQTTCSLLSLSCAACTSVGECAWCETDNSCHTNGSRSCLVALRTNCNSSCTSFAPWNCTGSHCSCALCEQRIGDLNVSVCAWGNAGVVPNRDCFAVKYDCHGLTGSDEIWLAVGIAVLVFVVIVVAVAVTCWCCMRSRSQYRSF